MLKDLLKVLLAAALVALPCSAIQAPEVPTESATVTLAVSDDTQTVDTTVVAATEEAAPSPQPEPEPQSAPAPTPQSEPQPEPIPAPVAVTAAPVKATPVAVAPQAKLQHFVDLMVSYQPKLSRATAQAYAQAVVSSSEQHGIDPLWIIAMMWQESRFIASATSDHGAIGLMQILPSTGRAIGYSPQQLRNPEISIAAGVSYLATLKGHFGDIKKATTAYNQGSSRVTKGTARMWYYNDVYRHYNEMKGWKKQHGQES